jgi:hypothetical protein
VRLALFGIFSLLAVLFLVLVRPFPQPTDYHDFADQRPWWGVPHAANVLSNVPFIVVGLLGIGLLVRPSVWRSRAVFPAPWERWAYLLLFAAVTVTGFGSTYYHLQPNNATLFWDRLPLAVVFMTFFALILADRVSDRLGMWLWPLLVAAGVIVMVHWEWTEQQGAGDMRYCVLVQALPLLMIPVLVLTLQGRTLPTADVVAILGWYVLAKVLEFLDGTVYTANGVVSGHTLKHLVAALGALWMVLVLARRVRVAGAAVGPAGTMPAPVAPAPRPTYVKS